MFIQAKAACKVIIIFQISSQNEYTSLGMEGTLPCFDKSLYIAYLENGIFNSNETISIENCGREDIRTINVVYGKEFLDYDDRF